MAAKHPARRTGSIEVQAGLGDVTSEGAPAVASAFREEWGQVVATLIRMTGDWDLAEECAQDAFAQALERWPRRRHPAPARRLADHDGPQPRHSTGCARQAAVQPSCARRQLLTLPDEPRRRPDSTTAASATTGCG